MTLFRMSSVFLIMVIGIQPPVEATSYVNYSIHSVMDILNHAIVQLTAVQKALPNETTRANPRDCADVFQQTSQVSGVHRIWPDGSARSGSFNVFCDMATDGGGWTVFQRRGNFENPKDYFYKPWNDYKVGFGQLTKEHWLGNDRIFALSNQGEYTLRIDLKTLEDESGFALYKDFWIEDENHAYTLHVKGYSGDIGDSFSGLNEYKFSTFDRDNDVYSGNCAEEFKGAWWYSNCHSSNLNGYYHLGNHTTYADGVNWRTWKDYHYSLRDTEMKIRPKSFTGRQQLK